MDFKVLIADSAIADLREIVEFVAEDNPERFSASRVVTLSDKVTIHNAVLGRRFRP